MESYQGCRLYCRSRLRPFNGCFPGEHALRHVFKSTVHPSGIVGLLLKTVIIVMHLGITSACLQASLRYLLSANMEHNTDYAQLRTKVVLDV